MWPPDTFVEKWKKNRTKGNPLAVWFPTCCIYLATRNLSDNHALHLKLYTIPSHFALVCFTNASCFLTNFISSSLGSDSSCEKINWKIILLNSTWYVCLTHLFLHTLQLFLIITTHNTRRIPQYNVQRDILIGPIHFSFSVKSVTPDVKI